MNSAIEERLDKLELRDGDLLVITMADWDDIDEAGLAGFTRNLRATHKEVIVVALPPGATVASLDEHKMGTKGWYRATADRAFIDCYEALACLQDVTSADTHSRDYDAARKVLARHAARFLALADQSEEKGGGGHGLASGGGGDPLPVPVLAAPAGLAGG